MSSSSLRTCVSTFLFATAAAFFVGLPRPAAGQPEADYVELEADVPADIYDQLARRGDWMDTEEFGLVWKPHRRYVGDGFEPFVTGGQWEPSDEGPVFVSYDLPEIQVTYEYGKWFTVPSLGWVWRYDEQPNSGAELRYGNGYIAFRAVAPFSLYGARELWHVVPEAFFFQRGLRTHFLRHSRWQPLWPALRVITRRGFPRHLYPRGVTVLRLRGRRARIYIGPHRRLAVRRWHRRAGRRQVRVRRRSLTLSPRYRRRYLAHRKRHPEFYRRHRGVQRHVAGPGRRTTVVEGRNRTVVRTRTRRGSVTTIERRHDQGRRARGAPARGRGRDVVTVKRRGRPVDNRSDNDRRRHRGPGHDRGVRRRGEGTPGQGAPGHGAHGQGAPGPGRHRGR